MAVSVKHQKIIIFPAKSRFVLAELSLFKAHEKNTVGEVGQLFTCLDPFPAVGFLLKISEAIEMRTNGYLVRESNSGRPENLTARGSNSGRSESRIAGEKQAFRRPLVCPNSQNIQDQDHLRCRRPST